MTPKAEIGFPAPLAVLRNFPDMHLGRMRVLSLCSGYGGIELGLENLFETDLVAVADLDPGASKILETRFPGIPNLGDLREIDWHGFDAINVLTAGFPCQDVSAAGARAGLRAGTRTGVWYEVYRAIDELRPPLVILENVRGLLSAGADSDMEPCPWCLGDESGQHALRALGAVLGDLSDLGYDAVWTTAAASQAGAPHRRERVFILAYPADADSAVERASAVEAGRGVVAAVEGDEEPGRRGDGQHAAAPYAGFAAWAEGLQDESAASWRGGAAYADADLLGWPGTSAAPGAAAGDVGPGPGLAGGGGAAPADAGGERLGQLAGGSPGEETWPEAGHEPGDHHGERADRDGRAAADTDDELQPARPGGLAGWPPGRERGPQGPDRRPGGGSEGSAADADDGRWHGRSFITLRGPTLREAAWRLGERLAADAAISSWDTRLDGVGEIPAGSRVEVPVDAGGGDGDDADAEFEGLEGESLESLVGSGELAEDDGPAQQWGRYAGAIARWERVLGRPAPRPAEPGPNGGMRLSPRFVEWMMGLPEGWVTAVPGLGRTAQLKALGNGVVPQQLELAVRQLLNVLLTGNRAETARGVGSSPGSITTLMPTPQTMDGRRRARPPEDIAAARASGGCSNLREAIFETERLPTPRAARGGSGTELMYSLGGTRSDEGRPQGEVLL